MIVCLRTVDVPDAEREGFLAWIAEDRRVRQEHGILAELVLDPTDGDGETVVITVWPSHEVFDVAFYRMFRGVPVQSRSR